jgi:hypothetical protein
MNEAEIRKVNIDDRQLACELTDGRRISVPLSFFPTLEMASPDERNNFEQFPVSIYWPDLDCDIGLEGLLAGAKELPAYAEKARARQAELAD